MAPPRIDFKVAMLLACVAAIVWVPGIEAKGLYSDDQYFVLLTVLREQTFSEVLKSWTELSGGRPLGRSIMLLLTDATVSVSLSFAYAVAIGSLILQSCLVFSTLSHFFSKIPALLAALLVLLHPVDVSKTFLVHAFWTQIAATLFWLSAYLYITRRPIVAGLILPISLLIYETHLVLFYLIPLAGFALFDRRDALRQAGRFAAALIVSGIPLLGYRLVFAQGRFVAGGEHSIGFIVYRSWKAMKLGIATAVQSLWVRVDTFFEGAATSDVIVATAIFAGLSLYLLREQRDDTGTKRWISPKFLIMVALAAASAVAISYIPFSVQRFPPVQTDGRLTNVHSGAIVGCIILAAAMFELLSLWSRASAVRSGLWIGATALYYGVLSGFFVLYDRNYAENWRLQTENAVTICQFATPGQTITVSNSKEVNNHFFEPVYSWTFPWVLEIMFDKLDLASVKVQTAEQAKGAFNDRINFVAGRFGLEADEAPPPSIARSRSECIGRLRRL